ncbi:MAG TPA: 8-amino-7-oxononanoate synthase [Pyrinomonadaceae bacterium]
MSHTIEFERRARDHLGELDRTEMRRSLQVPHGLSFCSNDYLGLATHPRVKEKMADAVRRDGCGSTGSRLLSGHHPAFTRLERRFARWKGTESALYFSSGYLANLGVLTTFLEEGDVVFSDELNHASLIDGLRLAKVRRLVFRHGDVGDLARLIERVDSEGQKFLVTESLFSMDGDEAPLAEYAALCRATNTALIVDEAHAVGIFGFRGSGLIEAAAIGADVFLSINPAGKALGVGGAFVAGPAWAIDYLIQRARTFIFSTAAPPAMAAALEAALDVIRDEPERRSRLLDLSVAARERLIEKGIEIGLGCSQIIPIIIGDTGQAVSVAHALQLQGYDVRAIRPPSVAPGTCRLRLSINVNLEDRILEEFSVALAEAIDRFAGVTA